MVSTGAFPSQIFSVHSVVDSEDVKLADRQGRTIVLASSAWWSSISPLEESSVAEWSDVSMEIGLGHDCDSLPGVLLQTYFNSH